MPPYLSKWRDFHFWERPNGGFSIFGSVQMAAFRVQMAAFLVHMAGFFPSSIWLVGGWFSQKNSKKTWWLPMPLLLFVVRGIEPSPSATALQTSSSYLVRPSSLFLPSLLSLILQAAVDAVSHFSHHPLACRQSANCSFFH